MSGQHTEPPSRQVLQGVPRVHFYAGGPRCPEDICFPSCLRACLEYMGENLGCRHVPGAAPNWNLGCSYAYLVGTSGAAFALSWQPGWQDGNADLCYISDDPEEPFRRAFRSVGYAYESFRKGSVGEDEWRRCVIDSTHGRGRPVIAMGVVGPPAACLVTGYDEGGEVVVGWSFFQRDPAFARGVTFEETGEFRKRGWFGDTDEVFVIGEKLERADQKEVDRETLSWALEVMRTPIARDGRRNGLAAYAAWADTILRDPDFCDESEAVVRQHHTDPRRPGRRACRGAVVRIHVHGPGGR